MEDTVETESYPWSVPYDDGSTGVEVEDTSSGTVITEPFNPTLIRVNPIPMNIDLLLRRIAQKALDLSPGFQRKGGIWTKEAQSRLIESTLVRIPISTIYVDATDEDRWLIVDGLQRLTALKRFVIDGELRLCGLEFLTQFNGAAYSDLPLRLKRRILETQIFVYAIQEGTPPDVKFNIFKRINTGGLPLSAQEIRHALNQGKATDFLGRIAGSREFLEAVARGISDKRMAAQECVLRFAAFTLTPYAAYLMSDLDGFLNEAMARMNRMPDSEIAGLEDRFLRAMDAARDLFGRDAFRKKYRAGETERYPINKALFEAWSVNLGRLSNDQIQVLTQRREALMERFIALMNQQDFNEAVSQGTGDVSKVAKRFGEIERIIREVLA